jgi:hypothetical protein
MFDRLISLVVALLLSCLIWLYASSRDMETLDNVTLPVQVSLAPAHAEHYDLEVTGPSQVTVAFSGTPSRLRELRDQLHHGQMNVEVQLAVPEERAHETRYFDTVVVTAADVRTPAGVTAMVLEGRNRIPVTLRRLIELRLPVRLEHAPDDRVGVVALEPETVLVRGPQDVLERARAVPTHPFCLPAPKGLGTEPQAVASRVALTRELEGRPIQVTPAAVAVRVALKPQQKLYTLADVPVHFLCPAQFGLLPRIVGNDQASKLTLLVRGPAQETPPAVFAFIDLTQRKFAPGLYADEPVQLQLPRDFQLAQKPPRSATFRLVPAAVTESTPGSGL